MTKLTKAEQRFLCIIHSTPPAELEKLFAQVGLSEEELLAFKKISAE